MQTGDDKKQYQQSGYFDYWNCVDAYTMLDLRHDRVLPQFPAVPGKVVDFMLIKPTAVFAALFLSC